MAFFVRFLAMVVVMMAPTTLQVSHAIKYKIGDSGGWTTIGNVDHYNERGALKRWHLNNDGGNHNHQEEVDGLIPHKRAVFLTFNKNFPRIDEQDVIDFFTKKYGALESYTQRVPGHAIIVFREHDTALAVLYGRKQKFSINGIFVWAKKYVRPLQP